MPYTHYHNFSFHTHHRRPKGGRHYLAVRRKQRLWRIAFAVALLIAISWTTWQIVGEEGTDPVSSAIDGLFPSEAEKEARQLRKEAEEEARQTEHEQTIIELINEERLLVGARALTWDPELQRIGRSHSRDMAEKGYFSHVNKAGQDYRQRALVAGYVCRNPRWRGVAENIFFGSRGHQQPRDAVRSWRGSPGHRKAMLDRTFKRAAVGIHEGQLAGYGQGYFTTLLLC